MIKKNKILIVDSLDCFAEEFAKVDLIKTTIKKAEFEECTFTSCDFTETFFHSCRFIDCKFIECNLSLLKLTDTTISGSEFIRCKMIGIDWTMCDWTSLLRSEPLEFRESILNDSNFYGLNIDALVMIKCSVKDVDFRLGSFMKADISSSDFKGALFDKTHVEYANFTDVTNTQINLQTNYIKGVIFNKFEALFLLESLGIVLVD
jgi:uncharacterized protein YjbI with pentapeptide repeats